MKLTKEQSSYISKAFRIMKSKEELLDLLNYCKLLLYGKKYFPISLSQLTFHTNSLKHKKRYYQFNIKKKSGADRIINSPNSGLKAIQRCLNLVFQTIYEPSSCATGFVPNRSILSNALIHTGHHYVFNIDLKDFFNSIDQARVWGRLQGKPFTLDKKSGRLELANMIASLCCHEIEVERLDKDLEWKSVKRNVLPQGAPTSPTLTNIICQQLDFYLNAAAKRFGLNYSRYADDITFSSNHNVYQGDSEFILELKRIISVQGFHIKDTKTRIQKAGYRQIVTGLTVNSSANLPPKYKQEVRWWLYLWDIYGYEKANLIFEKDFLRNSPDVEKGPGGNLKEVLHGKLNFLRMVRGIEDHSFQKLQKKYNVLLDRLKNTEKTTIIDRTNQTTILTTGQIVPIHLPIIHRPYELVDIMKMFTIENSVLKFATHTWDAGKDEKRFIDYKDFIKKSKNEFDKVSNKLQQLSPQLRAKILAFLFNKNVAVNGWGTYRIKFGWSSPEIANTLLQNPNAKPENIYLPDTAHFTHKTFQITQTIQRFNQVIDIFKNEIEIRDDNSALLNIILEFHDHFLKGYKIRSLNNLENKAFFTDVDYLLKVFDVVFRSFEARPRFREVSYDLIDKSDSYELHITQYGSYCKGISLNDEKFSLVRGDFSSIKKWLMNLCDWSIETEFAEGFFRLNFLASNEQTMKVEKKLVAEGFRHIFKFYK